MDKEKAEVMSVFKGMKKLADSRNAKLLIIIIPTDFQIHEISWIKYRLPIPLLYSDRSYPDRQFGEWFKEAGIDYVDLLPAFMAHQDQLTYFPLDDHWNTAGHSIAAETLMPILTHMLTSYPP